MLMRRDLVPIICYASLFAAIVAWAALGPVGGGRAPAPHAARAASTAGHLEPGSEDLEMRYLAQRMLVR